MKIFWKCTHPQAIQDVEQFIFSLEMILRNLALLSLTHQLILCSEWVPSEWESKQLIKTAPVAQQASPRAHMQTICKPPQIIWAPTHLMCWFLWR